MSNKPRCKTCNHVRGERRIPAAQGSHKNPDGSVTIEHNPSRKKPCGCSCH